MDRPTLWAYYAPSRADIVGLSIGEYHNPCVAELQHSNSMNDKNDTTVKKDKFTNPDLITGAPGSHPIGTGVGAVAGGVAAGAAIGTVAGPVGTIAGAAVGAVVGGLAGKSVAETVNPTVEAAYWRKNHNLQSFAKGHSYDDYGAAYRNGYEGYASYGPDGRSFTEREAELRQRYEATKPKLAWSEGRFASEAAWQRLDEHRLAAMSH